MLDRESANKQSLPQKRAEQRDNELTTQRILALGDGFTISLTSSYSFGGRLAIFNITTTALQLIFTPFFNVHTKPHLLIQIVCTCEAQTLHMRIPSNNCSDDDISLAVEDFSMDAVPCYDNVPT